MAARSFLGNSENLSLDTPHSRRFPRPSQHAPYSQLTPGAQRGLGVDKGDRSHVETVTRRESEQSRRPTLESHGMLDVGGEGEGICRKKM